jgi:hypothetical protein
MVVRFPLPRGGRAHGRCRGSERRPCRGLTEGGKAGRFPFLFANAPVAQLAEQGTLNPKVVGSIPTRCIRGSAPVAQLDRAPDYGSGGRRFESFRAHLCEMGHAAWASSGHAARRRDRQGSPRTGYAPVAELVDALDSGSSGRKLVEVRVLSGALVRGTHDAGAAPAQVLKLVDRPD